MYNILFMYIMFSKSSLSTLDWSSSPSHRGVPVIQMEQAICAVIKCDNMIKWKYNQISTSQIALFHLSWIIARVPKCLWF